MPTQYLAERTTIGNLLSMTNPPIVVPDWQRSYSWTSTEVETFWQDLTHFDASYPGEAMNAEEYFLGSVVLVDNTRTHLLLDGQQRLATSAILLSVIRDYLKLYRQDAATRVSNRYLTDYDDAIRRNTYKLTLNEYDRDFFKHEILEPRDGNYNSPTATLESHRLIKRARELFETKFREKYDSVNQGEAAHNWALRILEVLTKHVSVVSVVSGDEDNASSVFETLNDRGIGLSTPDLLRNLLLRRAADEDRQEIIDLWRDVLGLEEETNLKTFIRHYWISHNGDVKTQSLYREMKRNITEHNVNSVTFSRDLQEASAIYEQMLTATDDDETMRRMLRDVIDLGAGVLYPVLLSAYQVLEKETIKVFLKALITAFVRHNVIGKLENSQLESRVFSIARDLRAGGNHVEFVSMLAAFSPDDDAFVSSFKRASVSRTSAARYLLRELEHCMRRTDELDVATPDRVHVEHIYPQTPQQGQKWPNHTQMIDRIGNLTLLSRRLNAAIKNAPFDQKKPFYEQSDILITQRLAEYDEWNEENIESRQELLAGHAVRIWSFPMDETTEG